jgi:outer membrane protein
MKRAGTVTLWFVVVCAMTTVRAQSTSSMPTAPALSIPSNIAVVNFNAAVLGTAEAQRSMGALQKKYAPREQQLQRLNDDIEATKKSLNDAAAKLTDAERNQKLQDLGTKEKQLQREAEDFKNDSQAESQRAFQQVAQKVFSLLQEFSRQHGYAAVLEQGTETAPVVWYTASNVDITDQLIKSYDAKYAVGAASLPEKPTPKRTSPGAEPISRDK